MNRVINRHLGKGRAYTFYTTIILLLILVLPVLIMHRALARGALHSDLDLASYVNPFIGTDDSTTNPPVGIGATGGNVFPGAAYPHGMVQWSPDTTILPGVSRPVAAKCRLRSVRMAAANQRAHAD